MNWLADLNLSGGLHLIRKGLLRYTAERAFFWTLAFGWMVPSLVYLFVWMTVVGNGEIASFRQNDFIQYYLCLMLVNQFTYPVSHWTVGDTIKDGRLGPWLLRPIPVAYNPVTDDLALKVISMPFVIVLVLVLWFVLHPTLTITWVNALICIPSLLLAFALRFILGYACALLSFWDNGANALLEINDAMVFLLAGQVAPLLILPGFLRTLAEILPYRYMISFPIEVLLGKVSGDALWLGFVWQIGWLGVVTVLCAVIWRLGVRKYTSVGG